ncbi:MAG: LptE family protein [Paludibacteraceae bacterium]|nr:LptE family protein [Paludibacteraceae bacterium]
MIQNWIYRLLVIVFLCTMFQGCTVSYKFNGASIDYSKTKTISIADFPNRAPLVNPALSNDLSEAIRDLYSRQTRLEILRSGGQLEVEGEITGYTLTPMAVAADSYAAETKLTITVKVRFTDNIVPENSFNKTYTAYQTFDANKQLTDVQDELCATMVTEIAESIFNDTVAKW